MTRTLLRDFITRFFDGSPEALVMGLAESSAIEPEVWEELQEELRKQQEQDNECEVFPKRQALLGGEGAVITTVDSIPSWKAYVAKDSNGDVAQASLGFDMMGDDQLHYVEAHDNPNFTRLLLWYNGRITDEGLSKHLRGFRNLQTLGLNGTAVRA